MQTTPGHLFFYSEYAAIKITVTNTIHNSIWLYVYYDSGLIFIQ